jgi:hypothetical protein
MTTRSASPSALPIRRGERLELPERAREVLLRSGGRFDLAPHL